MVVQDIFLTATAELADVVLPAAAAWAESEGTVTNSERRVQRVRKALEPPGEARDDLWIIEEIARRMGADWGWQTAEDAWNEVRTAVAGPRRDVLPAARGARRDPVAVLRREPPRRAVPPQPALGGPGARQPRAVRRRSTTIRRSTSSTDDFPIRLTTGRRLDSYNTGVQTGGYTSPLRRGESLDISPEDAEAYGLADGERVRVVSRRGQVEAPVRIDESLRPGLTFMTLHFQDDVATNLLTIDATDPKSGTAEFKATAIRIEKLEEAIPA